MKTINKLTPPNLPLSLREGKKGNRNKKAFTLVELIIVITILAILATIAFVSFQNYTKDARDGNRITTLKNIESGLTLYNIKSNKYPDPEEYIEILSGNILLIKQGIVGNDIAQKIKLNKEAKDPKDKTNYIYSITGNGKKYQLGTYLEENKLISYIPQITKTYANVDYSKRYFYTMGDKVGILIEQNTNQPIIKTQYLTGINLETNTNSFKVYFSNDTQSGSLISSGNTLITTITETQKTTQTIKTTPTTINGVCGTANKIYSHTDTSYGADTFCETGTANPTPTDFPTESTPTNWTCEGSGSPVGTTANCSASKTATPINGTCGTAHNLSTPTQPTENLCTNSNPTSVTENAGNYTWSCEGVNLGTTANCSATRQYTITFNSNGGTDVNSQTVNYNGQATTPTQPTQPGNTFEGWYSDVGLTTAYLFTTAVTADRTLYAKWNINTYTVTFNSNGGTDVNSQTVNYNGQATTPTAPTKPGNTFGGWYSDAGLTTAYVFTTPVTSDITLYAQWTAICPWDQCLTNGYYVASSNGSTGYNSCAVDVSGYDKTKCILRIVGVSGGDIYVAPSNSDTTATHWGENTSWGCTSLTTTCSQLIGTTNGNAATFCTNLKNIIYPPVGTNWFLPPIDTGGLQTIQQNISKVNHVGGSSWYWGSSFYGSDCCGDEWYTRRLDTVIWTNGRRGDGRRVRCIAK